MAKIQPQNIPTSNNYHDFWWDEIKGIGQKRAEWLEDEFNVNNIAGFVALSSDEIVTRVQTANNIRWRLDEIESSIAKARELSIEENIRPQQDAVAEDPKGLEILSSLDKEIEWEYVAAFNVEFKVRKGGNAEVEPEINVRPVEITKSGDWGDAKGEKPTLVEGERIYQWMLGQLAKEALPDPKEEKQTETKDPLPGKGKKIEIPAVRMKITKIQAFQPPQKQTPTITCQAGKPFLGFLVADQPFNLQVSFDLVGSDIEDITKKEIPYDVQFFARDFSFGKGSDLGTSEPETLVDSHTSYEAKLSGVTLSPGNYRLRVLVKVKNTPPISDFLEVPLLQVV